MIPADDPAAHWARPLLAFAAPPVAAVCFAIAGDRRALMVLIALTLSVLALILSAFALTLSALARALIRRNRR